MSANEAYLLAGFTKLNEVDQRRIIRKVSEYLQDYRDVAQSTVQDHGTIVPFPKS